MQYVSQLRSTEKSRINQNKSKTHQITCICSSVGLLTSASKGSLYSFTPPKGCDILFPTPPGFAFRVLWVLRLGEFGILEFADATIGKAAVHRETNSQSTNPHAYISILKKHLGKSLLPLLRPQVPYNDWYRPIKKSNKHENMTIKIRYNIL